MPFLSIYQEPAVCPRCCGPGLGTPSRREHVMLPDFPGGSAPCFAAAEYNTQKVQLTGHPAGPRSFIHSFIHPPRAGLRGALWVGHGDRTGRSCPSSSLHGRPDTGGADLAGGLQSGAAALPGSVDGAAPRSFLSSHTQAYLLHVRSGDSRHGQNPTAARRS